MNLKITEINNYIQEAQKLAASQVNQMVKSLTYGTGKSLEVETFHLLQWRITNFTLRMKKVKAFADSYIKRVYKLRVAFNKLANVTDVPVTGIAKAFVSNSENQIQLQNHIEKMNKKAEKLIL